MSDPITVGLILCDHLDPVRPPWPATTPTCSPPPSPRTDSELQVYEATLGELP